MEQLCIPLGFCISLLTLLGLAVILLQNFCVKYTITPGVRASVSLTKRKGYWKELQFLVFFLLVKRKSVPLQAWTGPEGSRKLRFPNYVTTTQDGGKVVSLTHRPTLPQGNTPGTHFC